MPAMENGNEMNYNVTIQGSFGRTNEADPYTDNESNSMDIIIEKILNNGNTVKNKNKAVSKLPVLNDPVSKLPVMYDPFSDCKVSSKFGCVVKLNKLSHHYIAHQLGLYKSNELPNGQEASKLISQYIRDNGVKVLGGLFKCTDCNMEFPNTTSLGNHRLLEHGDKPFKCGICGDKFSSCEYLRRHGMAHNVKQVQRSFRCNVCGLCYGRQLALTNHLKTHAVVFQGVNRQRLRCKLNKNIGETIGMQQPFSCESCKQSFPTVGLLLEHEMAETSSFLLEFLEEECQKYVSVGTPSQTTQSPFLGGKDTLNLETDSSAVTRNGTLPTRQTGMFQKRSVLRNVDTPIGKNSSFKSPRANHNVSKFLRKNGVILSSNVNQNVNLTVGNVGTFQSSSLNHNLNKTVRKTETFQSLSVNDRVNESLKSRATDNIKLDTNIVSPLPKLIVSAINGPKKTDNTAINSGPQPQRTHRPPTTIYLKAASQKLLEVPLELYRDTPAENVALAFGTRINSNLEDEYIIPNFLGEEDMDVAESSIVNLHGTIKEEDVSMSPETSSIENVPMNSTTTTPFRCGACKKLFQSSSSLKNHSLISRHFKQFECNICDKRFKHINNLVEHSPSHSVSKSSQRKDPDLPTTTISKADDEIVILTPRKNVSTVNSSSKNLPPSKSALDVPHSGKEVTLPKRKLGPRTRGLKGSPKKQVNGAVESYVTNFVEEVTLSTDSEEEPSSLAINTLKGGANTPIPLKLTKIKRSTTRSMNRWNLHGYFKCDDCDKMFNRSRPSVFAQHRLRAHGDKVPFKCHRCPYESSENASLLQHYNVHKRICCSVCRKTFHNLDDFKSHNCGRSSSVNSTADATFSVECQEPDVLNKSVITDKNVRVHSLNSSSCLKNSTSKSRNPNSAVFTEVVYLE